MTSLVNNFRLYVLQKVVEHFYFSGLGKEHQQQQQQQQQHVSATRNIVIKKLLNMVLLSSYQKGQQVWRTKNCWRCPT